MARKCRRTSHRCGWITLFEQGVGAAAVSGLRRDEHEQLNQTRLGQMSLGGVNHFGEDTFDTRLSTSGCYHHADATSRRCCATARSRCFFDGKW